MAGLVAADVRIEDRPGLGRVVLAARAFAPGEVVLRERPSLSWSHDESEQLLPSFLAAAVSVQAAVLDMAMPAVDADLSLVDGPPSIREAALAARLKRAVERSEHAARVAKDFAGARVLELVEALLLIADCNAHAFEERVALFPLAAKANHSCDPSCGHSTAVGGEMRFFAHRAIEPGGEITISYLDRLWSTGRSERRRRLLLEKHFFCRCARCSRPGAEREASPAVTTPADGPGADSLERTVRALAAMECAAASCEAEDCPHGHVMGRSDNAAETVRSEHAPSPDSVGEATTAFLACCASRSWKAECLTRWIGPRYRQWAALQFGEHDRAVESMARDPTREGARPRQPDAADAQQP